MSYPCSIIYYIDNLVFDAIKTGINHLTIIYVQVFY